MRTICSAVAAAVLLCGVLGSGNIALGDTYLQGVGGDHNREFKHDRFYTGGDKAFHAAAYDFSGVGRSSDGKWVTMISERYFVSATHHHPSTDGTTTVTFYEGNTESGGHTYTIDSWSGFTTTCGGSNSDLWLGRLTEDVSSGDNIASYPVLDLASDSDYLGKLIYTYGLPHRVGLNHIDSIGTDTAGSTTTRVMRYAFDAVEGQGAGESEAYMMDGDSGGPSFTIWDGAPVLLGTTWYNQGAPANGKVCGDSFVPYYIDQLNDNMDFSQSVTTVPGPTSMILLSLGAITLLRRRRR